MRSASASLAAARSTSSSSASNSDGCRAAARGRAQRGASGALHRSGGAATGRRTAGAAWCVRGRERRGRAGGRDPRRTGQPEPGGVKVFAGVYGPPPRLVVVGAVDTAEALCAAAGMLGWHTICADPRAAFATRERIPSADELIVEWPDEALARIAPDHNTAVVV